MAPRPLPSPELLHQLLRYEPDTGKLYWRARSSDKFEASSRWTADEHCRAWNSKWAGREAFCRRKDGYCVGGIMGRTYRAHRVIWTLNTGFWPIAEIDHIDGDRANNRWDNLREADRFTNGKNVALPSNNTSSAIGVSWEKRRNRWLAIITVDGKRKQIGRFVRFDDAVAARQRAEVEFGFHPNHGRATTVRS